MLKNHTEPYFHLSLMFIYRRVGSAHILRVAVSFDIFTYGNSGNISTNHTYYLSCDDSSEQALFLSQIMATVTMTNTE